MVAKGHEHSANTEWVETKLFVPRGLRVSQYEVQVNGQPKKAKTYYLTTSGRHTATPAADRSKGRKVAA
jgi:hypothetical protein